MTETKKRTRKAESVEDLDQQILEMEAELAEGYGEPLSWEEVTTTTAEEMAKKEQRRSVLPRLIYAARVKRAELQKRRREEEAAVLQEKVETTYAALQEQEEKLRKAKERRDAAHAEWSITLSAKHNADERTKRAEKELRELKENVR